MQSRIFALLVACVTVAGMMRLSGCSSKSEATTVAVKVPTLQCAACSNTVEKALKTVQGVQRVEVDLKTKTAKVTFDAHVATVSDLERAVVKAGYAANDKKADPDAYTQLPSCCKVGSH